MIVSSVWQSESVICIHTSTASWTSLPPPTPHHPSRSSQSTILVAQMVKNLPAMQETQVWSLGREDPLEKGMATHSSILTWRIPWTEQRDGLQSMGLQRAVHDWATNTPTSMYYIHGNVHMSNPISKFIPHSLPTHCPCVYKSLFYICISVPSLQIGSSVPFFLIPHICIN